MAQETKIIDIRRSYIPIDPNAFPPTDHATEDEDKPEPRIPVVAYDGYNFMPTPQGYASFFGINSTLGINSLPPTVGPVFPKALPVFGQIVGKNRNRRLRQKSTPTRTKFLNRISKLIFGSGSSLGLNKVDDIFIIQTNQFQNILIALCDDGIWSKSTTSSGAWTHVITLEPATIGFHFQWSKCVIENIVYVYRQGGLQVYQAGPLNNYVFTGFTPSFLNMAGQLGIFKAGGRLGFWDSENSTAWAALGDPTNATPDPKTLAGSTIFQDIVGRIVTVLQHGNGFIIYCTKSIVLVTRNLTSPLIWAGQSIFNSNGISYREEVTFAEPDTRHYAFTTQGIVEIVSGKAEFVIPEVGTYLKEKRQPVYLKMLNGRYLFFTILDPYYLIGIVRLGYQSFSALSITFQVASVAVADWILGNGSVCKILGAINKAADTLFIFDILGKTAYNQVNTIGSVPIWEDHLSINIPTADREAWKATGIGGFGSVDYFDTSGFTQGGIAKIDESGNEFFVPTKGPALISAYPATRPIDFIESNSNTFFWKQDWIWFYERMMWDNWKEAIIRKIHPPVVVETPGGFTSNPGTILSVVKTPYITGPFIDLSFFSESNKFYGISGSRKSAWLQRSLIKSLSIEIIEQVTTELVANVESIWTTNPNFGTFSSYGEVLSRFPGIMLASTDASDPGIEHFVHSIVENNTAGAFAGIRNVRVHIARVITPDIIHNNGTAGVPGADFTTFNLPAGSPVYDKTTITTQTFSRPQFKQQDHATCTFKNLGFTKIKGHGHYTLLGTFIVDNATPEAADFTDKCVPLPPKKPQFSQLLDKSIYNDSLSCDIATTTINGVTYTYPPITVTVPGGTILLQEGSSAPIYPTFLGAFIYDTQYKKWGKMKQNYKQLLDYFPINNIAGDAPIPYDTFLPKCAALLESGSIALFDQFPTDSRIIFGKVGMYRKGFTEAQEVRIQNRTPLSGSVTVEGSLDGKNVESSITQTQTFADATQFTANLNLSARWYNIIVEGNYDITAMEARITRKGKR